MARKQTLDAIIKLYQKLGGNLSEIMGTKTNINFIGKGEPDMLKMDLNPDALGVLPASKVVDELKDSVSYAVGGKLNDIQANKLLENMSKMDNFYNPPPGPANITDLKTGVRDLDAEGIMTLRRGGDPTKYRPGDPITSENFAASGFAPSDEVLENLRKARELDDLPPPGSRGGADDIAAPTYSDASTFTGAGLEAIKNVKGTNLIINDIVDKIYMNAGVTKAAQPAARGNAREFLNRIKDLTDEPGNPTLASVMEADDFKFMTEGGGGGMGDPLLLVQKYFGPKVASSVAQLDSADDIQRFAERLVKVKDAKGNPITSRYFDPESVDIDSVDVDLDFADGGRVPMFMGGAARIGYQALRKYGFEAKDITRMFKELAVDRSLKGKEKTLYFQTLNKALKNPEEFPDTIKEMQLKLGIDVGTGFRNGGLAGILEV